MKLQTRNNIFNKQQPFSVKRNGFDISHKNITSLDMGKIYPVSCFHVVPNDNISLRAQYQFIMEALKKPPFTNIKVKFRSYFVAYRYLWKLWRNYYTRGRDGNYSTLEPKVFLRCDSNVKNSLYDYLGFPLLSQINSSSAANPDNINSYVLVSAFPFIAYDFIYYWNFINPHLQENIIYNIQDQIKEVNIDENSFYTYLSDTFYVTVNGYPIYTRCLHPKSWVKTDGTSVFPTWTEGTTITPSHVSSASNFGFLFNYNWEKDYFTSAYKQRQLGNPLSIPLTGTLSDSNLSATPVGSVGFSVSDPNAFNVRGVVGNVPSISDGVGSMTLSILSAQGLPAGVDFLDVYNDIPTSQSHDTNYMRKYLSKVAVVAGSFNWNDIRLIAQTSIIQEGALLSPDSFEYGGYLKYFFGTRPSDEVLQRPEFIGGYNSPFFMTEVYQNAPTSDSVLGEYAGKGGTVDDGYIGDYHVKEFGLIMTVCIITPSNVSQSSQGINKTWLYNDSFDYYNPAFAHLGLQGLYNSEVFTTGNPSVDTGIFGFTGAYNELRYIPDTVTSDMRDTMDYWHLARKYSELPKLTSGYIKENSSDLKRIFSVQRDDTPNIYGIINMVVRAYRPLPELAVPELIDHRF